MKPFLDDTFLLGSATAVRLFEDVAKHQPIIDYHCHLNPKEIYENRPYRNLTEVWLSGDHYKWRLMRAAGVDERYVTGDADDYEKFAAFARILPLAIGNPVHHWSHLELRRFFGVEETICEANAQAIWDKVNAKLAGEGFRPRDFIVKSNVKVVCTTDDPTDSLEYHRKLREDASFPVKVLPSFRPDKGLEIARPAFREWVAKLAAAAGHRIADYDDLLAALVARVRFFHEIGGRISDHALDEVPYANTSHEAAAAVFAKAMRGEAVSKEEEYRYKTQTLLFLAEQYAAHGWAMQFHIHAHRNNRSRMFAKLGPDTGYDSINDLPLAYPLVRLLDLFDRENALPKTILYSLNPADYPVIATVAGSFQGGTPGKIQFGAAWWFNDTKEGMIAQMKMLADVGLLGRFVGMLTDSRSFLSYTRHEYFRRILCDLIGGWVENGEYPADWDTLSDLVRKICYENAREYFAFD